MQSCDHSDVMLTIDVALVVAPYEHRLTLVVCWLWHHVARMYVGLLCCILLGAQEYKGSATGSRGSSSSAASHQVVWYGGKKAAWQY